MTASTPVFPASTLPSLAGPAPATTPEQLAALLADTGGQRYYTELVRLPVSLDRLRQDVYAVCTPRLHAWLDQCARCGVCAQSCGVYLASGNPAHSPAAKMQATLGELLRLTKHAHRAQQLDTARMLGIMDLAWGHCTCCNRCGVFCPFGIDVGVIMSAVRGLLFNQGFIPWEMKIGAAMHRVYGAQMDVTDADWLETCDWMAEEGCEEWPNLPALQNLRIPVDVPDCDTLYLVNAREAKYYPQDIAAAAALFHMAGERWTMTSHGWDATSLSLFAGDWDGCAANVRRVYSAVERLRPRRVVSTECGHAYRACALEGPYWDGRADGTPPAPFVHYVEWLAEALHSGRLRIDPARRLTVPVTIQDACNYVRAGGLGAALREVVRHLAVDVREMDEHGDHGLCCGGGGGLNGIGRYRAARDAHLELTFQRITATGARIVIAPCHNCWDAMRDMAHKHDTGMRWSLLKPLVLGMVQK